MRRNSPAVDMAFDVVTDLTPAGRQHLRREKRPVVHRSGENVAHFGHCEIVRAGAYRIKRLHRVGDYVQVGRLFGRKLAHHFQPPLSFAGHRVVEEKPPVDEVLDRFRVAGQFDFFPVVVATAPDPVEGFDVAVFPLQPADEFRPAVVAVADQAVELRVALRERKFRFVPDVPETDSFAVAEMQDRLSHERFAGFERSGMVVTGARVAAALTMPHRIGFDPPSVVGELFRVGVFFIKPDGGHVENGVERYSQSVFFGEICQTIQVAEIVFVFSAVVPAPLHPEFNVGESQFFHATQIRFPALRFGRRGAVVLGPEQERVAVRYGRSVRVRAGGQRAGKKVWQK